jgi:hypothetical protein
MLIIWLSIDINDNQPSIHLLRPQSLSFVNSYFVLAGLAIASCKWLLAVKLDQNSKMILTKNVLWFKEATLVCGDRCFDSDGRCGCLSLSIPMKTF